MLSNRCGAWVLLRSRMWIIAWIKWRAAAHTLNRGETSCSCPPARIGAPAFATTSYTVPGPSSPAAASGSSSDLPEQARHLLWELCQSYPPAATGTTD